MVLADFFKIFCNRLSVFRVAKKPSEVDEVQGGPEAEQNEVVFATLAHHGEKAPEGEGRKAEP